MTGEEVAKGQGGNPAFREDASPDEISGFRQ
jgi:hypothetical protein